MKRSGTAAVKHAKFIFLDTAYVALRYFMWIEWDYRKLLHQ